MKLIKNNIIGMIRSEISDYYLKSIAFNLRREVGNCTWDCLAKMMDVDDMYIGIPCGWMREVR